MTFGKFLKKYYLILIIIIFTSLIALQNIQPKQLSASTVIEQQTAVLIPEPIQPIPTEIEIDLEKVKLGDRLFHDSQLSGNNSMSCASCHFLNQGGADHRVSSIGMNNSIIGINSPTVFNSSFNFKQFWDGRAETLEDQIEGPINAEKEMASNWSEIISKLKKSSEYSSLFNQLYSDGITSDNIKNAIATFERALTTPNSRFDQFLKGNKNALDSEEKQGYELFKEYGCASCHQGVNIGGNLFQTFGVIGDYFKDRGNVTKADLGRFKVTGKEEDRYVFKVPSLRNVTLTSPYFHDGSAKTLDQAVKVMGKYQLGRQLSQEDTDSIIKFLNTLNGEYQGKPL